MNSKKTVHNSIYSWIAVLLLCGSVYFYTHVICILVYIPSTSMEKSVMEGDYLYGNRLYYKTNNPERGDIIVFRKEDSRTQYIKRLIGLPGETITIKDGAITIKTADGTRIVLNEPYLPEEWIKKNTDMEFHVPKDSYFFLGDNRNHSIDGRDWKNPFIKRENLIAKITYRIYPPHSIQ